MSQAGAGDFFEEANYPPARYSAALFCNNQIGDNFDDLLESY